jgi:hypothetical protein
MIKQNILELTTPSDREITLTRFFDAPRELAWKTWPEPESVKG